VCALGGGGVKALKCRYFFRLRDREVAYKI
jgi:hypothetical protein